MYMRYRLFSAPYLYYHKYAWAHPRIALTPERQSSSRGHGNTTVKDRGEIQHQEIRRTRSTNWTAGLRRLEIAGHSLTYPLLAAEMAVFTTNDVQQFWLPSCWLATPLYSERSLAAFRRVDAVQHVAHQRVGGRKRWSSQPHLLSAVPL